MSARNEKLLKERRENNDENKLCRKSGGKFSFHGCFLILRFVMFMIDNSNDFLRCAQRWAQQEPVLLIASTRLETFARPSICGFTSTALTLEALSSVPSFALG